MKIVGNCEAEKALQKATENNPYLQKESIERLKEYASRLQEASNFGDEGTIDVMAQLASTDRTEAEIMKIVGTVADYATAKHIDLKTAAETLNATYNGISGTIGRQIEEIKDLTDEQLKNGDAIDLLADKYKGFAEEAVDSANQSKNAFGEIANPTFEAMNENAKSFWEGMTAHLGKFNNLLETVSRKWGGIKKAVDKGVILINKTHTNKVTGEEKRGVSFQKDEYLKWLKEELEWREKLTDEEKSALFEITQELQQRERAAKWAQEEAKKPKKHEKKLPKQREKTQKDRK